MQGKNLIDRAAELRQQRAAEKLRAAQNTALRLVKGDTTIGVEDVIEVTDAAGVPTDRFQKWLEELAHRHEQAELWKANEARQKELEKARRKVEAHVEKLVQFQERHEQEMVPLQDALRAATVKAVESDQAKAALHLSAAPALREKVDHLQGTIDVLRRTVEERRAHTAKIARDNIDNGHEPDSEPTIYQRETAELESRIAPMEAELERLEPLVRLPEGLWFDGDGKPAAE